MPKPSFLDDDVNGDPKDKPKDPDVEIEIVDDPSEPGDDDTADDPADDDSVDEGTESFNGFDVDKSDDVLNIVLQRLDQIEKRISEKSDELADMTPEKFAELVKTDPGKAMDLALELKIRQMGLSPNSQRDLIGDATKRLAHDQTVKERRADIAREFNPEKNKKLHEAAKKVYAERKGRGISIDNDPDAEYDAYVKAMKENPALAPAIRGRGGRNAFAQPGAGGKKKDTIQLTKSQKDIAERWDLNIRDPKVARSIAEGARSINSRRIDRSAQKRGRNG